MFKLTENTIKYVYVKKSLYFIFQL